MRPFIAASMMTSAIAIVASLGQPLTRVRHTADVTTAVLATNLSWQTENIDDLASIAVTSANITIPTTGLYRVTGAYDIINVSANQTVNYATVVSAAVLQGTGRASNQSFNATRFQGSFCSTPLSLTAADVLNYQTGTAKNSTMYSSVNNHYQLEKLPATLDYCAVRKSADQNVTNATTVDISWNTLVAGDSAWQHVDGIHLTVKSGVTRVRVCAGLRHGSGGLGFSERNILLQKNDAHSLVPGLGRKTVYAQNADNNYSSIMTPPLEVTAGDTFRVRSTGTTASPNTVVSNASTFFSIETVPTEIKAAMASCTTSGNAGKTGGVFSDLNFDTEVYDDASMWAVGSPAEFVVPAGCYRARFFCFLESASMATGTTIAMQANLSGAGFAEVDGMARNGRSNSANGGFFCHSGWIAVNPGDIFKMRVFSGSNWSGTNLTFAWAALECQPNP